METLVDAQRVWKRNPVTQQLEVAAHRKPAHTLDASPVAVAVDTDQAFSDAMMPEDAQVSGAGSFETPVIPGPDHFKLPDAGVIFTADFSKGDLA